ncbi:Putative calmodulin-binding protein [Cavenderia fasciculata]|uniref:Calmodulin-binding protein n=1 Tax=Cavenderia fasciculata TaxID=261658 RepID=F4QA08_CACFS|nr:Putative calmodulin-binding protein [Cavenderia fasciculata]EGG15527.1 Putative calmodulin-binding protein [Cavenderia fasciculata]|eukprot:XP_004354269.1 Putative calmodulin-binding protein [Cavenderia fasciculata]
MMESTKTTATTNNVFNNLMVIDVMIPYLEFMSTKDLISFTTTCKANYKWRSRITFPTAPIRALQRYNQENRVHQLPCRFKELVVTGKEIAQQTGILPKSIIEHSTHAIFFSNDINRCLSFIPRSISNLTTLYLDNASSFSFTSIYPTILSLTLRQFYGTVAEGHLPPNLTYLDISGGIINTLEVGILPSTLETLILQMDRISAGSKPIQEHALPLSLRHLSLYLYNHPLTKDVLPPALETFTFQSSKYGYDMILPKSIKTLAIDAQVRFISSTIPPSVKKLKLEPGSVASGGHSMPVDFIPSSVETLSFTWPNLGSPMPTIPLSVRHLELCGKFENKTLDYLIPESVTHLKINTESFLLIPVSVTHIEFGDTLGTCKYVPNWLPNTVTHIKFGLYQRFDSLAFLPKSLTHLDLGGYSEEEEVQVKKEQEKKPTPKRVLGIFTTTPKPSPPIGPNFKDIVPNLKYLVFRRYIPQLLDRDPKHPDLSGLPLSCTHICFDGYSSYQEFSDKTILPKNLQQIEFGLCFNRPILPGIIPPTIKKICLLPNCQTTLASIKQLHYSKTNPSPFPNLNNNIIYLPPFPPNHW